jgi:hypothetical protein
MDQPVPLNWIVDELEKNWQGGWLIAPNDACANASIGSKVCVRAVYGERSDGADDGTIQVMCMVEQVAQRSTFEQVSSQLLTGDLKHDWYAAGCPPENAKAYVAVKMRRLADA